MPYKSAKQRGYLHIHHPEIAKRWDEEERKQKKHGKKHHNPHHDPKHRDNDGDDE